MATGSRNRHFRRFYRLRRGNLDTVVENGFKTCMRVTKQRIFIVRIFELRTTNPCYEVYV